MEQDKGALPDNNSNTRDHDGQDIPLSQKQHQQQPNRAIDIPIKPMLMRRSSASCADVCFLS
jgi:hypothetical protein